MDREEFQDESSSESVDESDELLPIDFAMMDRFVEEEDEDGASSQPGSTTLN